MKKTAAILITTLVSTGVVGQVSILFPELYFGPDLQDVDHTQGWTGLFTDPQNQYYIQDIEVAFEKVAHPMIDEEGEYSGIRISTRPGIPHYIFSHPELFHPGKVKNCVIRESVILPGDTLVIRFLEHEYKFTAKGTMQTLSSGELLVSDYALYISTGKCRKQLIGESEFFDGNMFEILWAGDLNNDCELDLIMDLSHKYSFREIVLFLSSVENPSAIFEEVGRSRMYFD